MLAFDQWVGGFAFFGLVSNRIEKHRRLQPIGFFGLVVEGGVLSCSWSGLHLRPKLDRALPQEIVLAPTFL